ncbi:MAG TPA: rod shape-determining protein MreC [Treponema sp.]|nr:rod shape-determining protein MreC [Treponema sp.]
MAMRVRLSFRFRFPEFLLVILMLVSGVCLGFSSGGFLVNFSRIGFSIISTVEKGVFAVSDTVKNTFGAVKELSELKKDYDELSKKLENYQQMQRSNAEIRKENEQLKTQLGFSQSVEQKNFPAQIISRDVDKLYASLTINKGSADGINKNMPVIAYQNGNIGLVGKIVEVGKFTSKIMPVYSLDCTISARIQNTRDLGLVSGMGTVDESLSMKYIKKRVLSELHFGDVIVTSGENGNYMRDVPLGTISKIRVLDYDSSLDIELIPIIDFSRLETVIVVDQNRTNDGKAAQ